MRPQDELSISTPRWLFGYVLQLVLVPIGSLFATFVVASMLRSTDHVNRAVEWVAATVCYLIPPATAFAVGFRVGTVRSWWADPGKAIWFPPVCLFAVGIVPGLFIDASRTLADYFVIDTRDRGTESGLGLILFTFPVAACCAYSLGIKLAERRRTLTRNPS